MCIAKVKAACQSTAELEMVALPKPTFRPLRRQKRLI